MAFRDKGLDDVVTQEECEEQRLSVSREGGRNQRKEIFQRADLWKEQSIAKNDLASPRACKCSLN